MVGIFSGGDAISAIASIIKFFDCRKLLLGIGLALSQFFGELHLFSNVIILPEIEYYTLAFNMVSVRLS